MNANLTTNAPGSRRRAARSLSISLLFAGLLVAPPAPAPPVSCTPPSPWMAGWWPGDYSATDLAGWSNDGTPRGGVAYGTGIVDQAFSLDGVDDYVVIEDFTPTTSLYTTATFDAWVHPTATPEPGNYFVVAVVGDSTQSTWNPMQCRMLYTNDLSPTTGLRFYMGSALIARIA